jgi:hypothetical protein
MTELPKIDSSAAAEFNLREFDGAYQPKASRLIFYSVDPQFLAMAELTGRGGETANRLIFAAAGYEIFPKLARRGWLRRVVSAYILQKPHRPALIAVAS